MIFCFYFLLFVFKLLHPHGNWEINFDTCEITLVATEA